jgi:hypothetical protein
MRSSTRNGTEFDSFPPPVPVAVALPAVRVEKHAGLLSVKSNTVAACLRISYFK